MKRPYIKDLEENYDYYLGSHWKYWCGPRVPANEPHATELMAEVERVFQSVNVIRECCDRHVAALIGKFPTWYLKDESGDRINPQERGGQAAQAELQLQMWLDAVMERANSGSAKQGDPIWKAVTDLVVTGEGNLRLWQPPRFENAADPIDRIHLHAPDVGTVEITRSVEDDFIDSITYSHGQGRDKETLDGDILTITRSHNNATTAEPIEINTGGRWTVATMRSPSMLNPQIKQNQNAINHAATMLLRNQEQAGFLERIFLNAQPPGEWVEDSSAPGGERFVVSDKGLVHGAGQDIFLPGIPSADGSSYSSPSVVFRDPVDPKTFLESIRGFRGFMYHAFGQGHLLADGDGGVSGVSRIQLRQDFEIILTRQKRIIESAIASTLNVVLKILGYEGLTAVVQLRVTTGKLSPEERKSIMEEYAQGLLSKSTAMSLLGSVDDVDAELAMMEEERQVAIAPRAVLPGENPGDDEA